MKCEVVLDNLLQQVVAAQSAVSEVRTDCEAQALSIPAEVDAVTTQLGEIKAMTKAAHAVLTSVHAGKRDMQQVALWTLVLLALPVAFIGTLELTGSDTSSFADDCESVSALTCFINVSILVWLCALITRRKLLPSLWPRTHAAMAAAKRDKAVGYALKTLFRFVVLVALLCLLPFWSFDGGLRMGGGPVYPLPNVSDVGVADAHAYCTGTHGIARRLWHSSKIFFLTIMVWELSFLPSSPWDMWLHHIGLILGVAFSTDHRLRLAIQGGATDAIDGPTVAGECLDGFAYLLMLGTAFMFAKELLVLFFYHRKPSKEAAQVNDLWGAALVHVLGQGAFYSVLPATYLGLSLAHSRLPIAPSGAILIALLLVLNVLEAYIFSVTLKVMHAKRRKAKAARDRQRIAASDSLNTRGPSDAPLLAGAPSHMHDQRTRTAPR